MPIARAKAVSDEIVTKNTKSILVSSKDGKVITKIDLTPLSKIVDATLANKGIVQLQTTIDASEDKAATPKAVQTVKTIADANAEKIKEIEASINEALPGEGTLADKLRDVAFKTKDNEFSESQTIIAKDATGTDTGHVNIRTNKFTHATGSFEAGTNKINAGLTAQDKTGAAIGGVDIQVADAGRDVGLNVVASDGQSHGIKVHIDKAATAGSVVAFAPATPEAATANEIATAKFVKDQLKTVQDSIVDATDTQRGLVILSDTPSENVDAATGKTAATPKAVATVKNELKAVTDVIGASAEKAALIDKENVFEKNQTINASSVAGDAKSTENGAVNFKLQQFKHSDGTWADTHNGGSTGIVTLDNTGAQIGRIGTTIDDTGSIKTGLTVSNGDASKTASIDVKLDRGTGELSAHAPSTKDEATGTEIATADFVNKKISGVQDNLVDATDSQRGLTLLSDAVDSDLGAAAGKTAATPKAVKTVKDALDAVTNVIGTAAGNVALKNAENTFTENNTFSKAVTVLSTPDEDQSHSAVINIKNSDIEYSSMSSVGGGDRNWIGANQVMFTDSTGAAIGSVGTAVQFGTSASINLGLSSPFPQKAGGGIAVKMAIRDDDVKFTTHTLTPDAINAADDEIATVKYVKDKVGSLNPDAVAYTNKNNVFVEPQTLQAKVAGTNAATGITAKLTNFDNTTGSFDGAVTSAEFSEALADKNGAKIAEFNQKANNTTASAGITVHNADASASAAVEVKYDRTSNKFTAVAPETDSAATANEIATAKFVLDRKAETDAALKKVTDVVGENAEHAALINKANTFTEPQKIVTDGKIMNFGGKGLATEGAADDALVLGSSFDTDHAELIIAANGSITRSEMPADPDDLELATVGYVRSLGDISGSLRTGDWNIAMMDFTQEAYQNSMDEGVFYSVPFNAADQYLQIDPETGKPADTQAQGVTDKVVDHFVIMYKAPSSKMVMNLGERKIAPDFDDVPLLSRDNTFAGVNTFNDAQKATPSVDPNLGDVQDKSFITKSELISYFTKNAPWNNVVTEEPLPEDMVPGQLYFVVEA